jgi:ribonuclease BN (tRNA processing enzyme)
MRPWEATVPVQFGANTVTPWRVSHPPESYGLTLRSETGGTLCFTGDTALCPSVIDMARGADILLAEASWTHDPPNRPPDLHMSGTEAGRLAAGAGVQELLLTHIPPWTAREDVIAEAKAEFAGPVHAVSPGEVYEF